MSQTTIHRAANDADLQARVQACVYSEALYNAAIHDTQYAQQVRSGYANFVPAYWAVAVGVEAQYENGVLLGRGSPGHDPDVVTDEAILSVVQTEWPADPPPVTP